MDQVEVAVHGDALAPALGQGGPAGGAHLVALVRVVDELHQGGAEFVPRLEQQAPGALLNDLGVGAKVTGDHGCSFPERLQHHHRKHLIAARGGQEGPGLAVEAGQVLAAGLADELHIRPALGQPAKLRLIGAGPGDHQIGGHVGVEHRDHVLQALDDLQPADEQEERPLRRWRLGDLGRHSVSVGHERGQQGHRRLEAERLVIGGHGLGEGDEHVDVLDRPIQHIGVAPKLRRALVDQRALQALAAVTDLAVVPPQHMGRADQPVFVGGVEFEGVADLQHARAADQRGVVVVDHVDVPRQQPLDLSPMHDGPAQLMGQGGGEEREAALQAMHGDPRRLGVRRRHRNPAAADAPGVRVMDDLDLAAAPGQGMGEAADILAIAAEVQRWIEGGDHGDAQGLGGHGQAASLRGAQRA